MFMTLILFDRENNQCTPRVANRQEEQDQQHMGSLEQHRIPQRYDHALIPFPLPTASAGPMALDPFAVVPTPPPAPENY
jgi:hypothetical protein